MPFISRRAQADAARAMALLRDRITELQREVRQVTDANARLASRADLSDSALIVEAASLRTTNAAHLERRRRLEEQVDALRAERDQLLTDNTALRKDRDRLQSRLDDALGYSPADVRVLDAGGHAAAARIVAAEKASAAK